VSGAAWREIHGVNGLCWLEPPTLPSGLRVVSTLRVGGVSEAPYASLNLGSHVGDAAPAVAENRRRLRAALDLPAEPSWLRQVHGTRILGPDDAASGGEADGAVARGPGVVLAVLTADCLPVVLASRTGPAVAVAHAGWRGLAAGVLEAALEALGGNPADTEAWLAPGIGRGHYVVGDDVRAAFAGSPGADVAFSRDGDRWHCDLAALARARLTAAGVAAVSDSRACTCARPERFFSHRRDGPTGRMATLAWRETVPSAPRA